MFSNKIIFSALLVTSGMGISTASAQEAPDCGNITFSADAIAIHPEIAAHCLEVVARADGSHAVRMHARVMRQSAAGTFIRYSKPDGSWGATRKANPPDGLTANLSGKDVEIGDMAVTQEVNIYVSNVYWSGPPAPVVAAAVPEPAPEPAYEPEPEPEPMPEALPTTASNIGLLAAIGMLFLLLGGVARMARNRG